MSWAQSWLYTCMVLVYDLQDESLLLFGASFRRLRSEKLSALGGALPLPPPGALPLDPSGGSVPRPPL